MFSERGPTVSLCPGATALSPGQCLSVHQHPPCVGLWPAADSPQLFQSRTRGLQDGGPGPLAAPAADLAPSQVHQAGYELVPQALPPGL